MKQIQDVAPTSLSHIVGQKSVVDQLMVALDASFADGEKMDDCLLVGPPGCRQHLGRDSARIAFVNPGFQGSKSSFEFLDPMACHARMQLAYLTL